MRRTQVVYIVLLLRQPPSGSRVVVCLPRTTWYAAECWVSKTSVGWVCQRLATLDIYYYSDRFSPAVILTHTLGVQYILLTHCTVVWIYGISTRRCTADWTVEHPSATVAEHTSSHLRSIHHTLTHSRTHRVICCWLTPPHRSAPARQHRVSHSCITVASALDLSVYAKQFVATISSPTRRRALSGNSHTFSLWIDNLSHNYINAELTELVIAALLTQNATDWLAARRWSRRFETSNFAPMSALNSGL